MSEFNSIFRKKNKLIMATMVIYCLISAVFISALIVGTFNVYSMQLIVFVGLTSLMALRSAYFVFEKVSVDAKEGMVALKILRKRFNIADIKAIKKIRKGQIRLITQNGKQFPISIDNEDEFERLLISINPTITIE